MKVRSLFYLITFFCLAFSGCKKDELTPNTIAGKWYVERYTKYDDDDGSYTPMLNYESVGVFDFYDNGTGEHIFDNQSTPFTYTISENTNTYSNSSSFNGITTSGGNSVNARVVNLLFDKSQIFSPTSPIVLDFDTWALVRYEVFTRTKGTLRFRGHYSWGASSILVEFVLTKLD